MKLERSKTNFASEKKIISKAVKLQQKCDKNLWNTYQKMRKNLARTRGKGIPDQVEVNSQVESRLSFHLRITQVTPKGQTG